MIVFVFSVRHTYTHTDVRQWQQVPDITIWDYERLFRAKRLPRATYILGDFDRLNFWELELAARCRKVLHAGGARVINDPARAYQRCALLKKWYEQGVNSFQVWRAEYDELPDRYPVFIRTQCAHRGVLTDLLHDPSSAQAALRNLLEQGYPRKELLFVEYAAEPIIPGLFRKLSAHRIGDTILGGICAHDHSWVAKQGVLGSATPALYEEELGFVRATPHEQELRKVFQLAEVEYGRVDYSIVKGRLEFYEINTNPMIKTHGEHPSAFRVEAGRLFRENYVRALQQLDMRKGPPIRMDDPELARHRKITRVPFRGQWGYKTLP